MSMRMWLKLARSWNAVADSPLITWLASGAGIGDLIFIFGSGAVCTLRYLFGKPRVSRSRLATIATLGRAVYQYILVVGSSFDLQATVSYTGWAR